MGYKNIGAFIARLEKEGELLRIRDKVSALLEITEITDRMSKSPGGGKALFFENVEGSAFPVVTNAFGSHRRIELAFDATPDELAGRLAGIIKQAPLPRGVDEMMLAGFLRQGPVVMVKGVTVDIEVPAEAEFILEGYVDPEETRMEGPFGDHTGYYSSADLYPVFLLTAITHRKNPVYSATVVGRPPMEDCFLAYTTERLFLPLLQMVMPEIRDYLLPWEGVFHSIAVISIEKEYPGHAAKIASGLWGSGQMSFAKALIIIDDQSLLADGRRLFEHLLNIIDFSSDVTISRGILDVLDHSADNPLLGAKIAIDATARIAGEGERLATNLASVSPESDTELLRRLQEKEGGVTGLRVLFSGGKRRLIATTIDKERGQASRPYLELLASESRRGEIFVLYDAAIDLADDSLLLWKAFNNVDPARDLGIAEAVITIDATRKNPADGHERPWPDDIQMTPEIKRRVAKILQKPPTGF